MKIHLLSGFLGSGKTTAIQQACHLLSLGGIKTAVITNDQGIRLVDGEFFKSLGIPSRQVVNGCFCCNYPDLDSSIQSLLASDEPGVLFAESVGSCTDIVATVLKPLLRYRPDVQTTVSVFADARLLRILLSGSSPAFDKTVRYIYFKQLEETGIIVVSKMDLLEKESYEDLRRMMRERYGDKIVLYQNSFDEGAIVQWLATLDKDTQAGNLSSLEIDYDVYGEGEARLAWLDQELEIRSLLQNAQEAARAFTAQLYEKIRSWGIPIGHLKFLLDGDTKISYTAAEGPGVMGSVLEGAATARKSATLLINARVQTDPENLSRLVADTIREMEAQYRCNITTISKRSFQPGYPRPTHRIME